MSAGFTKGPWSVFVTGSTLAVEPRAVADGTRPNIVDWTGFDSNDQPYSVSRANAHLIAAAPDMYEALEELCSFDSELTQEKWDNARAALAKARGEA